jgi:hypothetical protein
MMSASKRWARVLAYKLIPCSDLRMDLPLAHRRRVMTSGSVDQLIHDPGEVSSQVAAFHILSYLAIALLTSNSIWSIIATY